MSKYIKPIIAVAAVALCLVLAACGLSPTETVDGKTIVRPSDPISLDLGVDVSRTTADETLRRQYLAAGMKAVQAVLDRGGRLSLSVFFSRGLHAVSLLDAPVPTPEEVGGVARAQQVVPIREAAASALAEALGLVPRRPEVAEALIGLGGNGTDVAGSLAAGLASVDGQPNPVVIRLTDGFDADWTGDLDASPQALADRIAPDLPRAGHDVTVALVGIGGSASGAGTDTTERLLAAWRLACQHSATRCYVAPDLDLSRFIAG
jgi:hypothetical protein